jgi:DNA mismatch repair ATPase MutS
MSKLINIYKQLKQQNSETLYLFKSGIFYIFLEEDAKKISQEMGLKLTKLNDTTVKCGFPATAIDKYFNILNRASYKVKIIDSASNQLFTFDEFTANGLIKDLISKIKKVDVNTLSIREAYKFIEDIQEIANKI